MGNKPSAFTDEELEILEECTFFSGKEILRIFDIFWQLAKAPGKPTDRDELFLTKDEFKNIVELKVNPFRDRIATIFSAENEDGNIRFDNFLEFLSVFSKDATRDVKAFYAFKVYDFNDDGYLCTEDIMQVLTCLIGAELTDAEMKTVCSKVLQESDMDGDEHLSFVEFEHLIARSPDFVNNFQVKV